jgi:phosphatidate cytidylyltransferase
MRNRLLIGIPLALVIILIVCLDGYLSTISNTRLRELGLDPQWGARWLTNGLIVTLLVLAMTMLATRELLRFAVNAGYKPFGVLAYVFSAGLVAGPYVAFNMREAGLESEGWGLIWLTCAIGAAFFLQAKYRKAFHTMENLAITLFVMFYTGALAGFMVKLRMEAGAMQGVALLLFGVFVVKMTDTGAYFVGSALGKHKMIPWLSPKKTWEGFAGGIVVALVGALAVGTWLESIDLVKFPPGPLQWPVGLIVFGVVMALFSVAGDLCASLLKRDAHLKDSGTSLGGLGGMMDVLDSPLLAAPLAWFFWLRMVPMFDLGG